MTEEQILSIIREVLDGDANAFEDIVREYERNVYNIALRMSGDRAACLEARHHLPWYLRGVPHAAVYRAALTHVETLEDIRKLAKDMKRDLKDEKSEVRKP